MNGNDRRVVIIGGGIAGLCAGVYAQKCGYQAEILEMHDIAGGLATSWRRHGYTFETCLHWFVGSKPGGEMHALWKEVFEIDRLQFIDLAEFARIETEGGEALRIPTNVDELEDELSRRAPKDKAEIRRLANAIRGFGKFKMPDPSKNWMGNIGTFVYDLPYLPLLFKFSKL